MKYKKFIFLKIKYDETLYIFKNINLIILKKFDKLQNQDKIFLL